MTDPVTTWLAAGGCQRGELVGVAVGGDGTVVLADGERSVEVTDPTHLPHADAAVRPRWVLWSGADVTRLAALGVRPSTAWDLEAVHRLHHGRWRTDAGTIWAAAHGLTPTGLAGPPDLFTTADDADPVGADGLLHPAWVAGAWEHDAGRRATWARLALTAARRQHEQLAAGEHGARALATARVESTTSVLCAELATDGLPVDRVMAASILEPLIGPVPSTASEAAAIRARRDLAVLSLVPGAEGADLRSPAQVKTLLRRVGLEVPDTRAWRLESMRDAHPVVEALLAWRKAERLATTYGWGWLDQHVGADGRLRGQWTTSDGAAGRMTASAGLHNLPAELRPAVAAEPGHLLVCADLGQIEPRVLAAVSGDTQLAAATVSDDLYAPVATALGVDRATAKLAVLGAMYGQTTGHGAQALRRMDAAYPVAMAYLTDAARAAQGGRPLRTHGGRLVRVGADDANEFSDAELRARAAARGRYGRNALIQGAAAELFKMWAVTVRARLADSSARIVLCLHDELLVHTPAADALEVTRVMDAALDEVARRWAPESAVRFVAETHVVERWSQAKGPRSA